MSENLLDKSVIIRILSEMDKSEERERRKYAFDSYQIFSGNQETYVSEMIKQKRPKSANQYIVSDISIASMVTKKRSQSYMTPPQREAGDDELLEEIYSSADVDRAYQAFDETFNLNKHAMMWVNYRQEEDKFQFMPLRPYEFSLVRNKDTGESEIVILNYANNDITSDARTGDGESDLIAESQADSAAQGSTYVFWSKDQVVKVREKKSSEMIRGKVKLKLDIDYIPMEGNVKNVNPLGILPFIYLSDDLSVDMPTRNPLANQSVKFNYQWSEVMTAANIQGSGQFVLKYPESMQGKMDNMSMGLTSAIELPQSEDPSAPGSDATYINPNPDLGGQMSIALTYLKNVLKEHGIENENMDLGDSAAESGISKAIGGSNVQRVISRNQMLYEKVEQKAFEIVKRWLTIAERPGKRFKDDDELRIIYPKPKILISDKQTLEDIEKRLNLGLIEKWEAFVILDPNLSEEEAKEKMTKINQEKKSNMMDFMQPKESDVGVQSESSEQDDISKS